MLRLRRLPICRWAWVTVLYILAHNDMGASFHSDPSHIKHHADLRTTPRYLLQAKYILSHDCQYLFTRLTLAKSH